LGYQGRRSPLAVGRAGQHGRAARTFWLRQDDDLADDRWWSPAIFLDDRPINRIPAHPRNIGTLFQNYRLFPYTTVAENVVFGLEARGIRRQAALARAAAARAARRI
jgi:ABC-type uncharacterized transport system YnjBCD ATPase subunit